MKIINGIVRSLAIMVLSIAVYERAPAKEAQKVLLPSPGSSLISFRVLVKTGAAYDPPGKEGLASLTATTMAEGGTPGLTYSEVLEELYPMAAQIEAFIDKEVTIFTGTVHRDKLAEFYEIFKDVITSPRFDTDDFERERDNHINYLTKVLRGNDDEALGKEALSLFIYEDHPYGHVNQGTVNGLESLTIDDLKGFHNKYFTRDRITIGIAGGYPDELLEWVDRDFGSLPEGETDDVSIPPPKEFEGVHMLLVEKPCRATAISMGFPIDVGRKDEDFFPLLVANSYLGEHRTLNGVLMQKIREERGLNYGDYSYIEHFVQDGGSTFPLPNVLRRSQYFSIWIRPVAHENAHFAQRAALRELDRLTSGDVDLEALGDTRSFLANYSKLWVQTLTRRLGYKMDSEFYGMEDYIAEIEKKLGSLEDEEILEAAKRHLGRGNIKVAIVTEDAKALRDRILSNEPSPINYGNATTSDRILKEDELIENYEISINPENVRIVKADELFQE